jgi:hypothetical protein
MRVFKLAVAIFAASNSIQAENSPLHLSNWSRTSDFIFRRLARGAMNEAGRIVMANSDGTILTSPDGISWTSQKLPVSGEINECVYLNGLFILGGGIDGDPDGNNATFFAHSSDGVQWTITELHETAGRISSIAYGNEEYLALTGFEFVYRSKDGRLGRAMPNRSVSAAKVWHLKKVCLSPAGSISNQGFPGMAAVGWR